MGLENTHSQPHFGKDCTATDSQAYIQHTGRSIIFGFPAISLKMYLYSDVPLELASKVLPKFQSRQYPGRKRQSLYGHCINGPHVELFRHRIFRLVAGELKERGGGDSKKKISRKMFSNTWAVTVSALH